MAMVRNRKKRLTRRGFLHLAAAGLGAMGLHPWNKLFSLPDFPPAERLGRVVSGRVDLKSKPNPESQTVGVLFEDAVVPWLREYVGSNPNRTNQRWVETPDGYIWSPYLQPVMNHPNHPIEELPDVGQGTGLWVEVSVPYVDLVLDNPPPRSPWLKDKLEYNLIPRLYYSQIVWIDQVKIDPQGQVWYRVNEKFGSYGDIFWAIGEAFRPITLEEMTPISPEVEDKRVLVDVTSQTLSCFEGSSEVYFARISSGAKFDAQGNAVDVWTTPLGKHQVWRKLFSLHMSGDTTGGGWDLPAIGWTTLFVGSGVAVHSTFWHNNFGVPMSRGCVNASPDDAKWVFRWTLPRVPFEPGDATVPWPGGTVIEVVET
jgi:lipoprotein-anchoring transpeptidase ErfK/SrfK